MKKLMFLLVACVVLFSLVLVACNETPATTTAPKTTAPTSTVKPTGTVTPTATTAAVETGGTYRSAISVGPSRPIGYPPEAANDSYTCAAPALERLIGQRLDGSLFGILATTWSVADNGTSVTLGLRKGVKFSDGSDWNADVCKWNMDLVIKAKLANAAAWKSIDKVDDYTIRINVASYQNTILTNLSTGITQMVSKKSFDENGVEWSRWNPIGTGPFLFVSYARDSKLTYKRNPNYWDQPKPYLDGITMTVIADATVRKLAFQKGDIHVFVATGLDAQELQKAGYFLRTNAGGDYVLIPDSTNAKSPWADLRVRQAASYALDRDALAKALGFGFAIPAYQLYPGYADAKIPNLVLTTYNVAKAKELLTAAGYPSGFKTVIHNFNRVVPQDYLTAVAGQLRLAGFDVTTDFPEAGKYDDLRYKGWNDGLLNHGLISYDNKNSAINTYFSGAGFISLQMPAGFKAAWDTSISAKDYDTKLLQAVFKLMYDDMTVIPYIEVQTTTFEQKGYHNPSAETNVALNTDYATIWIEKAYR